MIELERTLEKLDGVKKVEINYVVHTLMVQYEPNLISKTSLYEIMNSQCKFLRVDCISILEI